MKHTDPVCGMEVEEKDAAGKSTYKGRDYYFCSPHCETRFVSNPDQFLVNAPRQ